MGRDLQIPDQLIPQIQSWKPLPAIIRIVIEVCSSVERQPGDCQCAVFEVTTIVVPVVVTNVRTTDSFIPHFDSHADVPGCDAPCCVYFGAQCLVVVLTTRPAQIV